MKVGDLVRVKESHWQYAGMIGIIIHDLKNKGAAFKVLLSNGTIRPKMFKQLEIINEN
jgi:hypothetical protein